MDHGVKVASVLANSFSRRCSYISESDAHVKEKAIQFGFVLGKSTERDSREGRSLSAASQFSLPSPVAMVTPMSSLPRWLLV